MKIKRGLSAPSTPGDDQRVLNDIDEFEAGEERTGDYAEWEELLTKCTREFVPRDSMIMVRDNHFETQADAGAVSTQKNQNLGRSGPFADAACIADIRLITAFSLRRWE